MFNITLNIDSLRKIIIHSFYFVYFQNFTGFLKDSKCAKFFQDQFAFQEQFKLHLILSYSRN